MISIEDQIRLAFRELSIEHETTWVWDFVTKNSRDFFAAEVLTADIIERRRQGEPLAYILGEWPFMGVNLKVVPGVLIPRPETEELAEKIVSMICASPLHAARESLTLLDLGAGSGALGIGVASELLSVLPNLKVKLISVERSIDAIPTLQVNLEALQTNHPLRLESRLIFKSWNELGNDLGDVDLLLGNPPYVSDNEWATDVDNSVKSFEPRAALTPEGLSDHQRQLAAAFEVSEFELEKLAMGPLLENLNLAHCVLCRGGLMGIEVGPSQAKVLESRLIHNLEYKFKLKLGLVRDLSNKLRFLMGYKNG